MTFDLALEIILAVTEGQSDRKNIRSHWESVWLRSWVCAAVKGSGSVLTLVSSFLFFSLGFIAGSNHSAFAPKKYLCAGRLAASIFGDISINAFVI